jgi:DNA-binding PadR family transcriptional regulator
MPVRHTILGLLAQRPRHGYELHAAFEAIMGGTENWDLKPAQVYTTLARLEEGGFIVRSGDQEHGHEQDRHVYAVTDKGRLELANWFNSPVESEHKRSEFFAKLMVAVFTDEVNPLQTLQVQRAQLYRELHDLVEQRRTTNPRTELAHELLLDNAVMHVEADLRWLEIVEARLGDIERQPLPAPEMRPRGRPRAPRTSPAPEDENTVTMNQESAAGYSPEASRVP